METVKLNPRQVVGMNPATEEEYIELQGTAILKTIGGKILQNKPTDGSEPKNFKVGTVAFDAGNGLEVHTAQIFEKTYNGNPEKGTEPVEVGDLVSLSITADEENTYMRVIGVGGGSGLQSADLFKSLMAGAKPVASQAAPANPAQAAPAGVDGSGD